MARRKLKSFEKNMVVVSSTYVVKDKMPILHVSRDEDSETDSIWQFHCGNNDFSMEKMVLVSLKTILSIDNSLEELGLEIGEEARRPFPVSEWEKSWQ